MVVPTFYGYAALGLVLLTPQAWAWDAAGHGTASVVGADLSTGPVHAFPSKKQEPLLFAAAGYPDIPFRKQSTEASGFEAEASNHYFHIDDPKLRPMLPNLRAASCPQAVKMLAKHFGKEPPENGKLPGTDAELNLARINSVGISPWRAEQFLELAKEKLRAGLATEAAYYIAAGSHVYADHAVPWHALSDAHGVGSGHPNIHIFLEGCADAFLTPTSDRYDEEFAVAVAKIAKDERKRLLGIFPRSISAADLAIRELQESGPLHTTIEQLDTAENFVSGAMPAAGTAKEAPEAARKPEACLRFKKVLSARLGTAAAYVSLYYDMLKTGHRGAPSKAKTPPAGEQPQTFENRPYPWFECPAVAQDTSQRR